jgi:hypothetical protein
MVGKEHKKACFMKNMLDRFQKIQLRDSIIQSLPIKKNQTISVASFSNCPKEICGFLFFCGGKIEKKAYNENKLDSFKKFILTNSMIQSLPALYIKSFQS